MLESTTHISQARSKKREQKDTNLFDKGKEKSCSLRWHCHFAAAFGQKAQNTLADQDSRNIESERD